MPLGIQQNNDFTQFTMAVSYTHLDVYKRQEEDAPQVRGEVDFTALAVFGRALHDALAGNAAAGAADGEQQTVLRAGEVRPLQSAQLAPAAAGVHGEQVEQAVVSRLDVYKRQLLVHPAGRCTESIQVRASANDYGFCVFGKCSRRKGRCVV